MFIFTRQFIISFFIEFGPLLLFFIGSQSHHGLRGFFTGTELLIATTPIAIVVSYIREKRFAPFPFIVGMFVLMLGGATLWFHNPVFIQFEFTIYNALFGLLLLGGLAVRKLPLRRMFDSMIAVDDEAWKILSLRFGVLLVVFAILNQIMLNLHAVELWVYFRFFSFIFGILFGLGQAFLVREHRLPHSSPWGLRN